MTKRFYRNRGTIWENDKSLPLEEVEERLNALHEENEQLKQDVTDTNMANSILQERVEHYRKENGQLKNNIKEAYETERTQLGKSILKQLMEQIQ